MFDRKFWVLLTSFLIFIIGVGFLPYLFTSRSWFGIDFSSTGQVGDTIGGITGPFIAIASAFLVFIAFWVQYKANEQQRQDIKLERFQTNFFELVRLHKANVDEININDELLGRKAFGALYDELRLSYILVEEVVEEYLLQRRRTRKQDIGFDPKDSKKVLTIAYLVFFYGTGAKSNVILFDSLARFCSPVFIHQLFYHVTNVKNQFRNSRKQTSRVKKGKYPFKWKYTPFEGHTARIGHYYRHLYQTAKFISESTAIQKEPERYGYAKTLRAQLSSYEQMMLYYNVLTPLGNAWLVEEGGQKSLMVRFKMIKNLPIPVVQGFAVDPEIEFRDAIRYYRDKTPSEEFFEWDELKKA